MDVLLETVTKNKTEDTNDQSRMKDGILQLTLQNTKGRGNLKELNHKRILWTTSCPLIRKIKFTNSYQKELQEETKSE